MKHRVAYSPSAPWVTIKQASVFAAVLSVIFCVWLAIVIHGRLAEIDRQKAEQPPVAGPFLLWSRTDKAGYQRLHYVDDDSAGSVPTDDEPPSFLRARCQAVTFDADVRMIGRVTLQ